MRVTLIAKTEMYDFPSSLEDTSFAEYDLTTYSNGGDRVSHFAGRACYQAWDMLREETANDMGYLANIIKQGHFSVLEHGSATFYIEGVSRNLTHELIRHRHLSYSELSQRYVDMEDANWVIPPAIRSDDGNTMVPIKNYSGQDNSTHPLKLYKNIVKNLVKGGKTRKQAREAARFYLPSGMETKIVVTGNHRAWRDMLQKRYSVHADAEIRELATELLRQLKLIAPGCYQDFPEEPFK